MDDVSGFLASAVAAEPLSVPLALLAAYLFGYRGGVKAARPNFDNR